VDDNAGRSLRMQNAEEMELAMLGLAHVYCAGHTWNHGAYDASPVSGPSRGRETVFEKTGPRQTHPLLQKYIVFRIRGRHCL
jgi:hypothetical protein